MVGLFRAISSGQLSPGIAEPLQYSCKSRIEIREKSKDLHRREPDWVRARECHVAEIRRCERVVLGTGCERRMRSRQPAGRRRYKKRARHIFRARASRRFRTL